MKNPDRPPRVVAILAGGQSRRMGSKDKAMFEFDGRRLIDRVIERVLPQADVIIISAAKDYATEFVNIPDQLGVLPGPAGGLWSIEHWLRSKKKGIAGFFTVPVDAPLLPLNLLERLEAVGGSVIAQSNSGLHPTFAYWECDALLKVLHEVPDGTTLSLKSIAENVKATRVMFDNDLEFSNINCLEDALALRAKF